MTFLADKAMVREYDDCCNQKSTKFLYQRCSNKLFPLFLVALKHFLLALLFWLNLVYCSDIIYDPFPIQCKITFRFRNFIDYCCAMRVNVMRMIQSFSLCLFPR